MKRGQEERTVQKLLLVARLRVDAVEHPHVDE